jgi:hypothetical protein
MPRCFMAKKLKYPYEQWKEQQNKPPSRSPSPMEAVEDEGFSSSSSSPQTILPNSSSMSDFRSESFSPRHVYGKWCSMLHDLLMIIFFYFVLLTEKQLLHILVRYSGSRLMCRLRLINFKILIVIVTKSLFVKSEFWLDQFDPNKQMVEFSMITFSGFCRVTFMKNFLLSSNMNWTKIVTIQVFKYIF